jgi:hypothetical protein
VDQELLELPVIGSTYISKESLGRRESHQPWWPGDVPALTAQERPETVFWLDAGDHVKVVMLTTEITAGGYYILRSHETRLSSEEDYWPSQQECQAKISDWVQIMLAALVEAMGAESEMDKAFYWTDAKRRYGIKSNPFNRFLFLLNLDPDGRSRFFYIHPPDHIKQAMRNVDCGVALACGVNNPSEEDLVDFP